MEAATNQEAWLSESADKSITVEQLDVLMTKYREARANMEAADEVYKAKYEIKTEAERQLITALEQAGKRKYQVDGVGSVHFSEKLVYPTPKTVVAKDDLFAFITKEYGAEFLKEKISIHHQTLQSICNDAFNAAKEKGIAEFVIPGLEQPTMMRTLNFRKEKT